jgi:hypothetical protein
MKDPSGYDLVVVGSPVWARSMAGPVRSYLAQVRGRITQLAAFCTEAGAGGETVLDTISQAAGQRPVASLVIRQSDVDAGRLDPMAQAFADAIRNHHVAPPGAREVA